MKRAELKVRNKISEYILSKIECNWEWKGYLGEIWIETERIAENTIINCYYSGIHYGRLRISEGLIIQFKVAPVGRGLLQLRWFLEQIKRDKDNYNKICNNNPYLFFLFRLSF